MGKRQFLILCSVLFISFMIFLISAPLCAEQGNRTPRLIYRNEPPKQYAGENDYPIITTNTLVDFGNLPEDTAIDSDNWRIELSGMSDTPQGYQFSDVKIVKIQNQEALASNLPANEPTFEQCMGIRVHFDKSWNNDWARIHPLLPVSDFTRMDRTGEQPTGMLEAVGTIRRVSALVRGLNYKHALEIRMKNEKGDYYNVSMGSLYYPGWKRIIWSNPDYIFDITKRGVVKKPLYPQYAPFLKLDSLVVYKAPGEIGGDFTFYIKDIRVEYETYPMRMLEDIEDEDVWEIQYNNASTDLEHQINILEYQYDGSSIPPDRLETYKKSMYDELNQTKDNTSDNNTSQ